MDAMAFYEGIEKDADRDYLQNQFGNRDIPDREAKFYQWIVDEDIEKYWLELNGIGRFAVQAAINYNAPLAKVSSILINYGADNLYTQLERFLKDRKSEVENLNGKLLAKEALEAIKKDIEDELLKRGFVFASTSLDLIEVSDKRKFRLISGSFQTTPVLFKEVFVGNGSSSIKIEEGPVTHIKVWISVQAIWILFSGGSNSTNLFNYYCNVSMDGKEIGKRRVN